MNAAHDAWKSTGKFILFEIWLLTFFKDTSLINRIKSVKGPYGSYGGNY